MMKECNDCNYFVEKITMEPVLLESGDWVWLCSNCFEEHMAYLNGNT